MILRPHAVYGPGDRTLLPRVVAAVRGRTLTLPEGAKVDHTLTHVDNLVDAVIQSLTSSAPAGVYNIGDATDVPLDAVITEFLHRRGMSDVRLRSVPYRVAFAAAGLRGRWSRPGAVARITAARRREPARPGAHVRPDRGAHRARLQPDPDHTRWRRSVVTGGPTRENGPVTEDHDHAGDAGRTRLIIALVITAAVMVAEVIGAWITGSLALLTDAAHMLTDTSGLIIALIASVLVTRPPSARRTWGCPA